MEGPPGVGKTSLIASLAGATCHKLIRINLSEQTDLADLFGAHLPQEDGHFAWVDGPLLRAFKEGSWVLVDELNLASQPVLEGLNACLDHRRCATIPELGIEVKVSPECRFFGAQNPSIGGGGRKNLPRSFLNRFTQVYVDQLSDDDYQAILNGLFPNVDSEILTSMIQFNAKANLLFPGSVVYNLRDMTRWVELLNNSNDNPGRFVFLIYAARLSKEQQRSKVYNCYEKCFDTEKWPLYVPNGFPSYHRDKVKFGHASLDLTPFSPLFGSPNSISNYSIHAWLPAAECIVNCCQKGWMTILVSVVSFR